MVHEPVSIEEFSKKVLLTGRISKIIRALNIDPERVAPIIRDHFSGMGIYFVGAHSLYKLMCEQVAEFINYSPDIKKILKEMRQREETLRAQKRNEQLSS